MVYALFAVGFVLLLKGADWLVDGASSLAKRFGISSLAIGLTVVAFGTSMPELVVNILSATTGAGEVAFGNIIGSNLFNLLLILGISAIIVPLAVQRSTTWKEIPFSLLAAVVLFIVANKFMLDGVKIFSLLRIDGLVLMAFFAIFMYYVFEMARRGAEGPAVTDAKPELKGAMTVFSILGGLAALFFGGKWVVDGAVEIARNLGVSDYLIAATIVAAGTSLPELVTSVVAARKKEVDLAVGNIIGSNIFNIFFILAVTAIIAPVSIPAAINADMLVLIAATVLLFVFMFIGRRHTLDRWQGVVFVLLYVCYAGFVIARG